MDHESRCEAREALDVVGRDVLLCGGTGGEDARPPTQRLGLPSFDEVAVVEHVEGRLEVVAASGPGVVDAVAREAGVGRGPSTEAITSAELVISRDLRRERRWGTGATGSRRGATELRRLVAAPVRVPGEPAVGAIVVAGRAPGIVTADEVAAVGALAEHSSLVLTAHLVRCRGARAARSLDQMRLVGMAVGVLMATDGMSEGAALARLRARSEDSGHPLFETAAAVLTERQMSYG